MYLFILNGPLEGSRFILEAGTYRIGRSPNMEISLPEDPFVSAGHAELRMDGSGKLIIRDIGSSNGTFLSGEPVGKEYEVRPGDIIQIGRTFFKYSRRAGERYILHEPERRKSRSMNPPE
jgi:pSer/pThr/pTyr-binding forkhead associated (FHA) protein